LSLEDIPQAFADAVGITEATAQVILSIAIIFALLLPTMLLARGKNATTIYLIMLLMAELLLVGLGWMPFWVLIATVAMMALAIAAIGTQAVTGE
jgi:cyanate permease